MVNVRAHSQSGRCIRLPQGFDRWANVPGPIEIIMRISPDRC